ncbi:type I secretion system permease/ATPase [Fulvimarina sp. MAC8]|uniref:type I secretion system permease/ATPase n=1 Tax=Fulvimarina sp. MAC8 TaxID=3162874 RepID=UPI0032F01624
MTTSPLLIASARTRLGFVSAIIFSFFINLLAFVGPIYMLQIYDRVITSRNETTLLFLTLIAGFLLLVFALLERSRSALLVRLGAAFDETARDDVFDRAVRGTLTSPQSGHSQSLRDLDTVREFMTGQGLIAFCDTPWVPIFIAGCFVLHPWFGYVALTGAAIILMLALANEFTTRERLKNANQHSIAANQWVQSTFRNAEALRAMGMTGRLRDRWSEKHDDVLNWQASASDRAGIFLASTKFARAFLQIAILGIGALLVIEGEVSAGAMIAASILMGRALAPVEQVVGQWKNFVNVRSARHRLEKLFAAVPGEEQRMSLPAPTGAISLENMVSAPPGQRTATIRGISFFLKPGEILGVVGPSGAGKSTLARVLIGVWPPHFGTVRYDGSEVGHWNPDELGQHVGYLPQDIELFDGTIAENIGRFSDFDDEKVIEAAGLAGCLDMIKQMPEGFNTRIGERGQALSGGQRQRIGLARALYGTPAVTVLDEPNSNLDADGEMALLKALQRMRELGRTVIIITHKPNVLNVVDTIAILANGQMQAHGRREEIMPRLIDPQVRRIKLPNAADQTGNAGSAQQRQQGLSR